MFILDLSAAPETQSPPQSEGTDKKIVCFVSPRVHDKSYKSTEAPEVGTGNPLEWLYWEEHA